MSHAESILSKPRRSPSLRSGSESKDFEKDDYLEAPMDVESDTPGLFMTCSESQNFPYLLLHLSIIVVSDDMP